MTNIATENHERNYNTLVSFYDFAEELISTVEHEDVSDPVAQLDLIEPIVEQIEEAADILTEEYRNYVKDGCKRPGMFSRRKIEKALGQLYIALNKCNDVTLL